MRYEATESVIEHARARQRELKNAELRTIYEEFKDEDYVFIFESLKGKPQTREETGAFRRD